MGFFYSVMGNLQDLLVADNTLGLNTLDQGIVDVGGHGSEDTGGLDDTVQDQLGGNTAGHADQASHS